MLDMFSFRGKSKNFLKLQKLLDQSEEKADEFFDTLPEKEQIRLLTEAHNFFLDQAEQGFIAFVRKREEEQSLFLGFSKN